MITRHLLYKRRRAGKKSMRRSVARDANGAHADDKRSLLRRAFAWLAPHRSLPDVVEKKRKHHHKPKSKSSHANVLSKFLSLGGLSNKAPEANTVSPSSPRNVDQQKNIRHNLDNFIHLMSHNYEYGVYVSPFSIFSSVDGQRRLVSRAYHLKKRKQISTEELEKFINDFRELAAPMPKHWRDKVITPIINLKLQLQFSQIGKPVKCEAPSEKTPANSPAKKIGNPS